MKHRTNAGQGGATFRLSKGSPTSRGGFVMAYLRKDGVLIIDLVSASKGKTASLWFDEVATGQIRKLLSEVS